MYKHNYKQCEKGIFRYVKSTNQSSFKIHFQKEDQHAGGKWLVWTKHHLDKYDINESDGSMFNPILWLKSQDKSISGGEQLQNQHYLVSESQTLGLKWIAMSMNIPVLVVIVMMK